MKLKVFTNKCNGQQVVYLPKKIFSKVANVKVEVPKPTEKTKFLKGKW